VRVGPGALALEDLVEEVRAESRAVQEALDPAVGVLLEREVAHVLDVEPLLVEETPEHPEAVVVIVTRDVEVEPASPADEGLQALEVRDRDEEEATGRKECARAPERRSGVAEVLEDVPEDDRLERTSVPGAFLEGPDEDGNPEHLAGVPRGGLGNLETVGFPPTLHQEVGEEAAAAADVEDAASTRPPFDEKGTPPAEHDDELLEERVEAAVLPAVLLGRVVRRALPGRQRRLRRHVAAPSAAREGEASVEGEAILLRPPAQEAAVGTVGGHSGPTPRWGSSG
jgi:hypothetical protein